MADARLVVGVVGSPERAKLAEQIRAFIGHLGRTEPIDRIRAGFAADFHELVADFVDRLVPIDAGPLAVDELHRIFQPALAADEFAHRGAFGAMRAAIDRGIPAWLLADPHAVCDFRGDGAADGTVRANAFTDDGTGAERAGGGRVRLANSGERHRAENGEAAGAYSRTAQKGAAIERGAVGGQACERATARLTV